MYHMDNLLSALGPFLKPVFGPYCLLLKGRGLLIELVQAKPRFLPRLITARLNRALSYFDCAVKLYQVFHRLAVLSLQRSVNYLGAIRFQNTRKGCWHLHDRQRHVRVHVLAVLADERVPVLWRHSFEVFAYLPTANCAHHVA